MVKRVTISAAREQIADIASRAYYRDEMTVLTKHGKDIAAVVSINDRRVKNVLPSKKPPKPQR